ncbi:MAG TPA: ABC transporter substrate-binding protein [Microthrixaceae bacterium]|nr:ABC transporter substrate-binding protein [Microthrixaceae bacterium]
MRSHFRRTLLGILVLIVALVGAACGDDDADSTGDGSGGADPSATAPETITIGYQAIPNGDLVVKHEGYLEAAFPDTEIEWKVFDSGGSVNEAILAGSIDFGLAGSSPVSRGLAQPIEYQVPWIHDVIGKAEALVVRDDIASIQDLKGKTIATPFASTSHYSLLAALEDAGVPETDVKIIDAEPDAIYAAWTAEQIDGAYVWNPNLAKLVDEGGTVLIDSEELSEKGRTTYDLAVVSNEFASKYPDAVTTWVQQQSKAVELYRSDPDGFAAALAAELNLSEEEALAQAGDLIFLTAEEQIGADYLGGGLAENLFASAEFNKAQGKIETVPPKADFEKAVVTTFAEQASKNA